MDNSCKINLKFENNSRTKNLYSDIISKIPLRKISSLFPYDLKIINIYVYYNKKKFLSIINKNNVPEWLIAYIPSNSTSSIFIYHEKYRLLSPKEKLQLFIHEITHLYTNRLNPNLPEWLKEGLSVYIANQIKHSLIFQKNWKRITRGKIPFKKISWKKSVKHNGYQIAGMLILFFVEYYGWNVFVIALRNHKKNSDFFRNFAKSVKINNKLDLIKKFESIFIEKK